MCGLSAETKKVAVSGVSTVVLWSTFINSRIAHLQELWMWWNCMWVSSRYRNTIQLGDADRIMMTLLNFIIRSKERNTLFYSRLCRQSVRRLMRWVNRIWCVTTLNTYFFDDIQSGRFESELYRSATGKIVQNGSEQRSAKRTYMKTGQRDRHEISAKQLLRVVVILHGIFT